MSQKEKLLQKLFRTPMPKNFTVEDLDALMSKCNCQKDSGGRGSAVRFTHASGRTLQFDGPHPGKELYTYQVKMVKKFLELVGEV